MVHTTSTYQPDKKNKTAQQLFSKQNIKSAFCTAKQVCRVLPVMLRTGDVNVGLRQDKAEGLNTDHHQGI